MSETKSKPTVAVVGLGLIGGSAAAGLHAAGWHVAGFDGDPEVMQRALQRGWIDVAAGDLAECVGAARLVLLALPVAAIVRSLPLVAEHAPDGAVVLDMGSTKVAVCAALDALPGRLAAMGGHPMTGRVTSDVPGVTADLFRDRVFALTDTARTTPAARQLVLTAVTDLGATPLPIDAHVHDDVVASISHVPHFLAVALLRAVEARQQPLAWDLAAGGFKQLALRAADNPRMWSDIAHSNGPAIAVALRQLAAQLQELAQLMDGDDAAALDAALEHGRSLYVDRFGV